MTQNLGPLTGDAKQMREAVCGDACSEVKVSPQKAEVPSPLLYNLQVTVGSSVSRQKNKRHSWRIWEAREEIMKWRICSETVPWGHPTRKPAVPHPHTTCARHPRSTSHNTWVGTLRGWSVPGLWTEILLAAKSGRDKKGFGQTVHWKIH